MKRIQLQCYDALFADVHASRCYWRRTTHKTTGAPAEDEGSACGSFTDEFVFVIWQESDVAYVDARKIDPKNRTGEVVYDFVEQFNDSVSFNHSSVHIPIDIYEGGMYLKFNCRVTKRCVLLCFFPLQYNKSVQRLF